MKLTLDFLSTTNGCKKIWNSDFKISKDMLLAKSSALPNLPLEISNYPTAFSQ